MWSVLLWIPLKRMFNPLTYVWHTGLKNKICLIILTWWFNLQNIGLNNHII